MGGTENLPVGPGILGFISLFVLGVALWFLMRNMNDRMRRMAYRERDRLEQEQLEQLEQGLAEQELAEQPGQNGTSAGTSPNTSSSTEPRTAGPTPGTEGERHTPAEGNGSRPPS